MKNQSCVSFSNSTVNRQLAVLMDQRSFCTVVVVIRGEGSSGPSVILLDMEPKLSRPNILPADSYNKVYRADARKLCCVMLELTTAGIKLPTVLSRANTQ